VAVLVTNPVGCGGQSVVCLDRLPNWLGRRGNTAIVDPKQRIDELLLQASSAIPIFCAINSNQLPPETCQHTPSLPFLQPPTHHWRADPLPDQSPAAGRSYNTPDADSRSRPQAVPHSSRRHHGFPRF